MQPKWEVADALRQANTAAFTIHQQKTLRAIVQVDGKENKNACYLFVYCSAEELNLPATYLEHVILFSIIRVSFRS